MTFTLKIYIFFRQNQFCYKMSNEKKMNFVKDIWSRQGQNSIKMRFTQPTYRHSACFNFHVVHFK